jgi:hypothetical protein
MTQAMLQQLGYKVLAAPGPMEAIQVGNIVFQSNRLAANRCDNARDERERSG